MSLRGQCPPPGSMAHNSTALDVIVTAECDERRIPTYSEAPLEAMTTKDPSVDIRIKKQDTVFTLSSMGLESHQDDKVFVRVVQLKMLIAD